MGTWQKLRRAHTKAAGQRLQLHAPSISGDKQEKKGGKEKKTKEKKKERMPCRYASNASVEETHARQTEGVAQHGTQHHF